MLQQQSQQQQQQQQPRIASKRKRESGMSLISISISITVQNTSVCYSRSPAFKPINHILVAPEARTINRYQAK